MPFATSGSDPTAGANGPINSPMNPSSGGDRRRLERFGKAALRGLYIKEGSSDVHGKLMYESPHALAASVRAQPLARAVAAACGGVRRRQVLLPTGAFGRYWAALVRIVLTEAGRALSHRVSGSVRVDDWRIVVCCMLSACCVLSMLRGPLG